MVTLLTTPHSLNALPAPAIAGAVSDVELMSAIPP